MFHPKIFMFERLHPLKSKVERGKLRKTQNIRAGSWSRWWLKDMLFVSMTTGVRGAQNSGVWRMTAAAAASPCMSRHVAAMTLNSKAMRVRTLLQWRFCSVNYNEKLKTFTLTKRVRLLKPCRALCENGHAQFSAIRTVDKWRAACLTWN